MGTLQNQKFPKWVLDMINAEFFTGKGNDVNYRAYFCADCGGTSLRKVDVETEHRDHRVLQALTCSREYGYNVCDVMKISDLLDVSGVCSYKVNHRSVFFPKSRKKGETKRDSSPKCVVCEANLSNNAKAGKDRFCSILCKLMSGCGGGGGGSESIHEKMLQQNEVCLSEKTALEDVEEGCKESGRGSLKLKIKLGVGIAQARETDDDVPKKDQQRHHEKKRKFDEVEKAQTSESDIVQKADKLDKLISAALEVGKNASSSLSYRKRSRKGIPHRSPMGVELYYTY